MLEKINVAAILSDHWATLYSFRDLRELGVRRTSRSDVVLFYILPAVVAVTLIGVGVRIVDNATDLLLAATAILAGLLLNLLVLLYGLLGKENTVGTDVPRGGLLREIYANVLYSLLVALAALLPLATIRLSDDATVAALASVIALWLLSHFMLTLLMVLKRMHLLLRERFK